MMNIASSRLEIDVLKIHDGKNEGLTLQSWSGKNATSSTILSN
jgi:hypothetical protein